MQFTRKVEVDCADIYHMSCRHWRLQALELLPKRAAPEGGFSGLPGLKVLKVGSRWVFKHGWRAEGSVPAGGCGDVPQLIPYPPNVDWSELMFLSSCFFLELARAGLLSFCCRIRSR